MMVCSKCGSDDIEVEILWNLKSLKPVFPESMQDLDEADCFCNDCGEWTQVKEIKDAKLV